MKKELTALNSVQLDLQTLDKQPKIKDGLKRLKEHEGELNKVYGRWVSECIHELCPAEAFQYGGT